MHKMANKLRRRIFVLTSSLHFPLLSHFLLFPLSQLRLTLHMSSHIHLSPALLHPIPLPPAGTGLYRVLYRAECVYTRIYRLSRACHPDQSCTPPPRRRCGVSARKLAYSSHLWQYRLYSTPEIFIGASADFPVKERRDIARTAGF